MTIYNKQPAVFKLLKKFPCSVQFFIPPYPRPDKSTTRPLYLLVPKPHLYFCTHCTCHVALPFYSPSSHQPVQFGKQYKSEATLYMTLSSLLLPPLSYV
jgi:hypothetical protein